LDRNSAANAFGPYKSVIRPERPETLQPTRCRLSALLRFRRGGHLARSFTAFQEQLGLKLNTTKAPADLLVIDNVSKPSEN